MMAADWVGWCATAVFVGSYFAAQPSQLRRLQMLGASMWMVYGIMLGAPPVIVANVLVLAAAAWTARARHVGSERAGVS